VKRPSPTIPAWSRRHFLSCAAISSAALATLSPLLLKAQTAPTGRFKFIGFTKPFQTRNAEDTADLVAEVGWDGIECPVRAKGQILPERVEEDLPKMVEALRRRNLELAIMATDIRDATNPLTQKVLRTASKLGIRRYRLGERHYHADTPIPRQLDEIRAELRDLVALNKELGLHAGMQNHSGQDYVGAPVWDIYDVIREFDPKYLGVFFDIGHATLEGGYSWPIQARLIQPYIGAVYVKDFAWNKTVNGWEARWCPLGEGAVHREFFQTLRNSAFTGLICQHHEYELGDRTQMVRAMKQDLRVLKDWLAV